MRILTVMVGYLAWLIGSPARARDERGGDAGPGTIVLILGAILIAGVVIAAVKLFVDRQVGQLSPG